MNGSGGSNYWVDMVFRWVENWSRAFGVEEFCYVSDHKICRCCRVKERRWVVMEFSRDSSKVHAGSGKAGH
jgi:hypothetical protein